MRMGLGGELMRLRGWCLVVFSALGFASSAFAQEAAPPAGVGAKNFADIIDIAPWGLAGKIGRASCRERVLVAV